MAGFEKLLDIRKQNEQIVIDEEREAIERCEQLKGRRELNCDFCDLRNDCDITWRRMGVCC